MRYTESKEYWPVLTRPSVAEFNPPGDSCCACGEINLLESMRVLGGVTCDYRLSKSSSVTGLEGGVPLTVLFTKLDDDDIRLLDRRSRANRVYTCPLAILPGCFLLIAKYVHTDVVTHFVIRNR